MKARIVTLAIAVAAGAGAAARVDAQIAGVVKDAQGRPLAGVTVNAQLQEVVETGTDGTFQIEERSEIVRFFKQGYRPSTRMIEAIKAPVVLEAADLPLILPKCTGAQANWIDVGTLHLPTPKRSKRRSGSDIDYVTMSWRYRGAWLQHGTGPMWSFGFPLPQDLRGLTDVVERDVRVPRQATPDMFGDELLVLDIRGAKPDGRRFRFVGVPFETFQYDDATPEQAAFFDRMLDAMCYLEPSPPPGPRP